MSERRTKRRERRMGFAASVRAHQEAQVCGRKRCREREGSESLRSDVLSPNSVRDLIEWGRGAEYGRHKLRDFIADMDVTSLACLEGAAHELECLADLIRRSIADHRQSMETAG